MDMDMEEFSEVRGTMEGSAESQEDFLVITT